MKLFETEKTVLFKRASFLLFVISLIFLLLVQPPLYAQDDDDEFLISLPTKKKDGKASNMPVGTEAAAPSGEMLQGVLYDLNRMDDGRLNKAFGGIPLTSEYLEERIAPTVRVLRPFVNGIWRREYDSQGKVHYPELDKYYRSATPIWRSHFYTSEITSDAVMDSFGCEDKVSPASWCCIYSG